MFTTRRSGMTKINRHTLHVVDTGKSPDALR